MAACHRKHISLYIFLRFYRQQFRYYPLASIGSDNFPQLHLSSYATDHSAGDFQPQFQERSLGWKKHKGSKALAVIFAATERTHFRLRAGMTYRPRHPSETRFILWVIHGNNRKPAAPPPWKRPAPSTGPPARRSSPPLPFRNASAAPFCGKVRCPAHHPAN